jgi:hypothetical protein
MGEGSYWMGRLCCLVLLAAGCGSKSETPAKPAEVTRPGFRIAVPAGYQVVTDEKVTAQMPADAVALSGKRRDDGSVPSIVVVPLADPMKDGGTTTDAGCAAVIAMLGSASPQARVTRHELIQVGSAPACSGEIVAEGSTRGAIFTYVPRDLLGWVVTCNLSTDDKAAVAACREVLTSWKPDPAS